MYILGLSSYSHESSAALIKDGAICSLIEQERLNREKHTWKFPKEAIEACLKRQGIGWPDIAHVTFFWNPVAEIKGNLLHVLRYFPASLNLLAVNSGGEELTALRRLALMRRVGQELKEAFQLPSVPPVHFVEHHLAHAASAFFISPFDHAAIITWDGRGESTSTLLSIGDGNKITKVKEIKVPHSLGHLYAAVTEYLGFKPFFDEWKVMGMSAYGNASLVGAFHDLVHLKKNGEYELDLEYFQFHTHGQGRWVSQAFLNKFGPARKSGHSYEQRHFDIAAGLQRVVEKTGVHVASHFYELTKIPNLCMTGGVALNCLMNKEIIRHTPFTNFFIQPIASDAGTSLGSALYYHHQELNQPRREIFESAYLGPEFTDEEILAALKQKPLFYKKCDDIAKETAPHIAEGKIVGWFQGRMEAGPRALGNRSITVSPLDPTMKERLNGRVKKREFFRPFAPSILEERVHDYFWMPKEQLSPYMILTGDVRPEKRGIIPAVTHADHTARVHTVNKKVNPRYWQLIAEFEKLTGVPVLLNTSFNENEPIVCTPQDAINCFSRTEFDVLAIGDYLVTKKEPS